VCRGEYFWGGSHIGYNRMNFRGPDFSSFQISPGSHMDQVATHWFRKGPIPVTVNIGIPPACTMMAGAGFTYVILPRGCDELGVAGALQGYPVELVKARTQDAWSIANAEYVIEGYLARARYNVEVVDLAKFYSPEQIRQAKAGQRDYAKFLADRGI